MSMTCDCSIDSGAMECLQYPTSKIVKARKTYRCCECREEIPTGTRYEYFKGVYDGEWSHYRTCLICKQIREDYCPHGWMFETLYETIAECLGRSVVDPQDDSEDWLDHLYRDAEGVLRCERCRKPFKECRCAEEGGA